MFDLIIGGRQSGKTTLLIDRAAKSGAQIIAADSRRAAFIEMFAKQYGTEIAKPISVTEFIRMQDGKQLQGKILIDDADAVLERVFLPAQIEAISITDGSGRE